MSDSKRGGPTGPPLGSQAYETYVESNRGNGLNCCPNVRSTRRLLVLLLPCLLACSNFSQSIWCPTSAAHLMPGILISDSTVQIISRSILVKLFAAHMWEVHNAEFRYLWPYLCSQLNQSIWCPKSAYYVIPDILISDSTVEIVSRSILVELGAANIWEACTDY